MSERAALRPPTFVGSLGEALPVRTGLPVLLLDVASCCNQPGATDLVREWESRQHDGVVLVLTPLLDPEPDLRARKISHTTNRRAAFPADW